MYRHNKYENLNAEEEIDKLKEKIKQLQRSNTEKVKLLKEIEGLNAKNINLKDGLKQSEENYSLKDVELLQLSEQVKQIKTNCNDDLVFLQKSIELFKFAMFKEDSEADIKMYVLGMQERDIEFMWEENVKCPDCHMEFENIARLGKHDMKYQFKCLMCGKCLKEKKSSPHDCGPDHSFEKTPLKDRRPNSSRFPAFS